MNPALLAASLASDYLSVKDNIEPRFKRSGPRITFVERARERCEIIASAHQ
jgi:hypothetical protein